VQRLSICKFPYIRIHKREREPSHELQLNMGQMGTGELIGSESCQLIQVESSSTRDSPSSCKSYCNPNESTLLTNSD